MPTIRVGVQDAPGGLGQIIDDGVPTANVTLLSNLSASESVAYSTNGGASWATVAAGGTAVPGPVSGNNFRVRRVTAGGYPVPIDVTFTEITSQVFYDPASSTFRLRDTTSVAGGGTGASGPIPALQTWYQALAGRDMSAAKIVGIGDSWMEYRTATAFGRQWTQLLPKRLRTRFPTTGIGSGGGIGYVPIQNVSIFAPYTNPWTVAGAVTQNFTSGGLGLRYTTFGAAGQTATITFTGTHAVIHYLKAANTRVGYYKVDGGAAVTFETNNGAVSDNGYVTVGPLTSGSHTLEVGWSSGGQVYIAGAAFYDGDLNSGIQFYEGGHTAYRTTDYLAVPALDARIATIGPHLLIIALGQNDFAQGAGLFISAAQYKANLITYIARLRAAGVTASILLMTSADMTAIKNAGQTSSWAEFVQAAKDVAATDTGGPGGTSGVYHIALSDAGRIPASPGSAGGIWADAAHGGDVVQSWIADVLVPPLSLV